MRIIFALLAFLAFSCPGAAAFASGRIYDADRGESFGEPTYRDMGQLLFQLNGVDPEKQDVIDEYAKMFYCGLYKEKYKDDFEWDKVRRQLRQRIASKKDYYRTLYELDGTVDLDRYSFDAQAFPLTNSTAIIRVGSMVLYDATAEPVQESLILCGGKRWSVIFPVKNVIIFRVPLTFDRLKVSPEEAKAILDRMDAARNRERRLWVRFRMRVTGLDSYGVSLLRGGTLTLKGEMVSLDVFYDKDMTKLLTTIYIPHL